MPPRPKGKVSAISAREDEPVPIIELLLLLIFRVRHAFPPMRVPFERIGEVSVRTSHGGGCGQENITRGDDHGRTLNGHGVLDLAHDGVDWGMQAERFADGVRHKGELFQVFVRQWLGNVTQHGHLFLVQFFDDLGLGGEPEEDPGARDRGVVLAGHKECNHHVGNLVVGEGRAIFVDGIHKVPDHILAIFSVLMGAARIDYVGVDLRHLLLSFIAAAILGERHPGEHEVDGLETVVKVVVELGESCVELFPDLLSLQRTRRCKKGDLGHDGWQIEGAGVAFESSSSLEEHIDLVLHQRDVAA